jgi:hypothetical protein
VWAKNYDEETDKTDDIQTFRLQIRDLRVGTRANRRKEGESRDQIHSEDVKACLTTKGRDSVEIVQIQFGLDKGSQQTNATRCRNKQRD